MKRYRCHKVVEAAAIVRVNRAEIVGKSDTIDVHPQGERAGYIRHPVPHEFFARGAPAPGDYLVCYLPDGYLSWSPRDVFEAGYTAE